MSRASASGISFSDSSIFLAYSSSNIGLQFVNMPAGEEALALKKKGNEAFSKHEWLNAVDFYTKAIESYDSDPVFFSNRCQVGQMLTGKCSRPGCSYDNYRRTSS